MIATSSASQPASATATYTVEGSGNPLVATIVTTEAPAKAVDAASAKAATSTAAGESAPPPNVTAPSAEGAPSRAPSVNVDVSAATVQAVQAAIEAARQQGALPYTMRLRNNPPKPA